MIEAERALLDFVDAINATGGVTKDHEGFTVPVFDEDFIDLGEAYMRACAVLNLKPMYENY